MIFTLEPMPCASPRRYTLPAMAASTSSILAYTSAGPEVIMVISPEAARAAPPETGASSISKPCAARRCPSAIAKSGATVALEITTLPGLRLAAAPFSPNSTVSVCAALTTKVTSTSTAAPSSAGLAQATPPSAANLSSTSLRTSQAYTLNPARSNERATPSPIAPKPMTPTFLDILVSMRTAANANEASRRVELKNSNCYHDCLLSGCCEISVARRGDADTTSSTARSRNNATVISQQPLSLTQPPRCIEQMRLGGGPCGHLIADTNGGDDGLMLFSYLARKVIPARFVATRDGGGRLQILAEKLQRLDEIGIVSSTGQGTMKCHVSGNSITAGADVLTNARQRGINGCHIRGTAALGGLGRHFSLDRPAQLNDLQHGLRRTHFAVIDAQRLNTCLIGDEHAAALARLDHTFVLEPGNSFAHHRAADAKFLRQHRFSRQFSAARKGAEIDFF